MANIRRITLEDKTITLLGTAHVSSSSAEDVKKLADEIKPDNICIELDEERYNSLVNHDRWADTDITKVIKEKRTTLLLVNIILSSYQARIASSFDVDTGVEMQMGMKIADKMNIPLTLADRNIKTTFLRIFRKMSFFEKIKLLAGLISSFFDDEDISEEDLEELKTQDFIEGALTEIGTTFPDLKRYLVDERDIYLSQKIRNAKGKNILAVLGAAHLDGVEKNIQKEIDIEELDTIPKGSALPKVIGVLIPLAIIVMIVSTFFQNKNVALTQIFNWILYNSTLSAFGVLLAGGSVLSILTAVVAAPITSLNPLLAAGWFAGLVEAWIRKPKVSDFENLSKDLSSMKGLWKNRVTKVLLVVTFANLGSTIGTFVGGLHVFSGFSKIFIR